jgi:tRNA(fMet)-specific endonuclease VapC
VAVKVLLDTSAYSELKRGHPGVAARIRRSTQVLFSAIVAGELMHGFRSGTRLPQNRAELEDFLGRSRVAFLPVDLQKADRFGRIASQLRRRGTPIPTNDIWIAAHAMQHGADLLSFDAHFDHVEGLAWEHYAA